MKYEARSAIDAEDWLSIFANYKNTTPSSSYETRPLINIQVKNDLNQQSSVVNSAEASSVREQQFRPPPKVPNIPIPKTPIADNIASTQKPTPEVPLFSKQGLKKNNALENLMKEMNGKLSTPENKRPDVSAKPKLLPRPASALSSNEASSIKSEMKNKNEDLKSSNSESKLDSEYDAIQTVYEQKVIENDDEKYENSSIIDLISNYDLLYLCIYDTNVNKNLQKYELDLKRGCVVQLIEMIHASNYFIARYLDVNNCKKSEIGLVNLKNVLKIYNKI